MAYERREYAGGAVITSLSAGISSAATSFSIADTTEWPDGTVGPFHVVIDEGTASEEKIRCLSRAGSTITVDTGGRGADGTTAASHSATAAVAHVYTAVDADEANVAVLNTVGRVSAVGDLLVGNGANTLKRLARGAASTFLRVKADGTDLEFASAALTDFVTADAASSLAAQSIPDSGLSWVAPPTPISVSVTVGASGRVQLAGGFNLVTCTKAGAEMRVAVAASGANTFGSDTAPLGTYGHSSDVSGGSESGDASGSFMVEGLTPGATTFALLVRPVISGGDSFSASYGHLSAVAL